MTAKRGSVRHGVRLACPPDEVWALLGAPERVPEWFPGITSCTVDGNQRVVVTGSGIPMPEQLLTVDPTLRRFQYRITAPMFVEHLSTIDVHDLGDGTCLAVYSVDADPAPLALVIGGAARAGLEALAGLLGLDDVPAATTTTTKGRDPSDGPQDPSGHH
jgi:Polyketide cyclase / dehydrase and lipid transport